MVENTPTRPRDDHTGDPVEEWVEEWLDKKHKQIARLIEQGRSLFSTPEVAKIFGVRRETISHWCKSGKIKCEKVGSQWIIKDKALLVALFNVMPEVIRRKLKN